MWQNVENKLHCIIITYVQQGNTGLISVSHLWSVQKDDSPFWLQSVSFLTLCFDVIHSWTRSFDGDLAWTGTAPCVVYCPQSEPGHINTRTLMLMWRKCAADCEWYIISAKNVQHNLIKSLRVPAMEFDGCDVPRSHQQQQTSDSCCILDSC